MGCSCCTKCSWNCSQGPKLELVPTDLDLQNLVSPTYLDSELVYPRPSLCRRKSSTKAVRCRLTPGGRHKDCRCKPLPRVIPRYLGSEPAYLRPPFCHRGNRCTKAVRHRAP